MQHFVYILKSLKDNKYYIGVTKNIQKRFNDHNQGRSRSTKSRRPFELVYSEQCVNINIAYSREKYLKSLKSRSQIEKIISKG